MWEVIVTQSHAGIKIKSKSQIERVINDCTDSYILRRKETLALPFNLQDAKNGGKVEWFNGKEWVDVVGFEICNGDGHHYRVTSINDWVTHNGVLENSLRMKEPPLKDTKNAKN